jgi:hypothetical protein
LPLACQQFEPNNRRSSEATFMPGRSRQGVGVKMPAGSEEELEAALLREYLRSNSVAALARSLAARIDDGRSAEEFIAAAQGGAG